MSDMKEFIGVKIVKAKPMHRSEWLEIDGNPRGITASSEDHGYLVEYDNGYQSWCPKNHFEEANRPTSGMTFGHALEAMKKGKKVARNGWNGKGMFIFLVQGSTFKVNRPPLLGIYPEGTEVNYHAHIDMKTADGMVVPWLASQTDMLSDDWEIVE